MRIPIKALEIATKVSREIVGRAADGGVSLPYLAATIMAAPDGDHVDIGSLFGASAITVALAKKEMGHKGKVYCIDPYDEEQRLTQAAHTNRIDADLLSASPEELMENAKKFDVELELIHKCSHPWPEELKDATFVTAYIDGDHMREAPWNDFVNLRGRVSHYISCDNYEEEYADVVKAIWKAMNTDDWFLYYKTLTFVALRRVLPHRSDTTAPFSLLSL